MMERIAEDRDEIAFVRRLCPHLAEHELREAHERWLGYVNVVVRTAERVAHESPPEPGTTELQVAENDKIVRRASISDHAIMGPYENANQASTKEGTTPGEAPTS